MTRLLRRLALAALPAAVALGALCGTAGAASPPGPLVSCKEYLECGVIEVPLDRADPAAGRLELVVSRLPARRGQRSGGALLFLTGGPGQAGIARDSNDFMLGLRRVTQNREVIAVDVRGSGRSGALGCPSLQRDAPAGPSGADPVADCASVLGPARRHFTTTDIVADLEQVRQRLGIERWAVGGVSYGTYVATRYARAHPERVERLLLDSLVPPEGVGAVPADTLAAASRVMRGLGPGVLDDVARLEQRLARRSVAGTVVDRRGAPRRAVIGGPQDPGLLSSALLNGDLNPAIRSAFPAAVRSALDGDSTLLMRLVGTGRGGSVDATQLSGGALVASLCGDTALPWSTATPTAARTAMLDGAVDAARAAVPASPFSPGSVAALSTAGLCVTWPEAPGPPALAGLPPVPVLVLAGRDDVRTPVENARRLAREAPGVEVVVAPHRGHSLLGGEDCATVAVRRFFAGAPAGRPCAGLRPLLSPAPEPPASYAEFRAGLPDRRTATAVIGALRATLEEVPRAALRDGLPTSGLRGGTLEEGPFRLFTSTNIVLSRFSYVPGVRVSGSITPCEGSACEPVPFFSGRVTVQTPAGRATARLGEDRVRILFPGRPPIVLPGPLALDP